jgi:hypothetical protein
MMTEEEAKTKWCPMVRTTSNPSGCCSINRLYVSSVTTETRCIASECMAWRWFGRGAARPDRGYCGLAGKAEGRE